MSGSVWFLLIHRTHKTLSKCIKWKKKNYTLVQKKKKKLRPEVYVLFFFFFGIIIFSLLCACKCNWISFRVASSWVSLLNEKKKKNEKKSLTKMHSSPGRRTSAFWTLFTGNKKEQSVSDVAFVVGVAVHGAELQASTLTHMYIYICILSLYFFPYTNYVPSSRKREGPFRNGGQSRCISPCSFEPVQTRFNVSNPFE